MRVDIHPSSSRGALGSMLEEVARRALDPEPAFENITDRLIGAEKRLFASARLKEIKDSTKARKARDKRASVRSNANRTLVATGDLERYLTTRSLQAQPVKLTRSELLFGVPGGRHDFHYARYQAKHGRNPVVSGDVVRRWAGRELKTFLTRV